MVINKDKVNPEEFLKIFDRKFEKFCNRLPLLISYTLGIGDVVVFLHKDSEEKEKLLTHSFDYNKSVESNINDIKNKINDYLPVLIEVENEEITASTQKVNDLMARGEITLNDITKHGYTERKEKEFVIDKVFLDRDEIFLKDNSGKEFRYKMKYPVVVFLRKLRTGELDGYSGYKFLEYRSEFLSKE